MREKLIEIISDIEVCVRFWEITEGEILPPEKVASIVADKLIEKGVTILPEGAIILTRKELDALNEYQKKRDKELAEEIFELIDCAFSPVLVYNGYTVKEYLAELKKKYTEEGK